MFQGYGLSEASPVISSNSPRKHKLGSSGTIVSGLSIRICDEKGNDVSRGRSGEIVVKGDNVMDGYWKNEETTKKTIMNGWLYTGDLGHMDTDGFLYVVGRVKSLLIASDGEKFSPEGMEETFSGQSEYISQCMLYNNQDPYTVLLLVPNREKLKSFLRDLRLSGDSIGGRETALIQIGKELQEYGPSGKFNGIFPRRWLPAAAGILAEGFTEENHLMNSTMKIVRGKIIENHKVLIEYLYTPEGKVIINPRNMETMKVILA
jgi:long-chain acyl-CoA synthetase